MPMCPSPAGCGALRAHPGLVLLFPPVFDPVVGVVFILVYRLERHAGRYVKGPHATIPNFQHQATTQGKKREGGGWTWREMHLRIGGCWGRRTWDRRPWGSLGRRWRVSGGGSRSYHRRRRASARPSPSPSRLSASGEFV